MRLKVRRRSPVYQTEPFGVPDQPKFLNMVVEAQTDLPPVELLRFLKGIERELRRSTAGSDAPRPIDIDILFYGQVTLASEALTIPHPRLPQRGFVLVPLNDLAPQLKHPMTGKTVREMLAVLDTTGVEKHPVPARATGRSPSMSTVNRDCRDQVRNNMYYITVESHFRRRPLPARLPWQVRKPARTPLQGGGETVIVAP